MMKKNNLQQQAVNQSWNYWSMKGEYNIIKFPATSPHMNNSIFSDWEVVKLQLSNGSIEFHALQRISIGCLSIATSLTSWHIWLRDNLKKAELFHVNIHRKFTAFESTSKALKCLEVICRLEIVNGAKKFLPRVIPSMLWAMFSVLSLEFKKNVCMLSWYFLKREMKFLRLAELWNVIVSMIF